MMATGARRGGPGGTPASPDAGLPTSSPSHTPNHVALEDRLDLARGLARRSSRRGHVLPVADDASDDFVGCDEESRLAAASTEWFAEHLRGRSGEPLGVLDLPGVNEGELLPHELDGVGRASGSCTTVQGLPGQFDGGAQVLAALATVIQWLTRAEGHFVVGVEGCGPLLNGRVLPRPLPIKVPFPSSAGDSSTFSPASLALNVCRIMRVAVGEHGPHLGHLADFYGQLGAFLPESTSHHGIFQVLVAFEGQGDPVEGAPDELPLTRVPTRCCPDSPPLAMVLVVRAGAPTGVLKFRLVHSLRRVSKSLAGSVLRHLCRLLELPLSEWKRAADELPLASDDEWETVLNKWSIGPSESLERFTHDDGGDLCVHELFEHRRRGDPGAKAIVSGEAEGPAITLTYAAADAWASALALRLHGLGVGRGEIVALLFERCPAMVVAIYAVLKAGGCYCPCDTAWPQDRLASVLEGGTPVAALCAAKWETQLRTACHGLGLEILVVEDSDAALWTGAGPPSTQAPVFDRPTSTDPCYVFFTSGSTGKPKGVVVEHSGLVHRVRWLQHDYRLAPIEAALLKHAYTFGLSEWEIFWPLSYGACVVTCTPGAERDPAYMVNLCQRHNVSTFVFVPSALQAFLESCEDAAGASRDRVVAMAKQIIACGEPLRPNTVHMAHRVLTHARVDNVFGPTEGEMTRYVCARGRPTHAVPVGKPIDGSTVYVLGPAGQLCGADVPGELMYAGPYIARGYLSQPELTAEKFVPDPFKSGARDARMYKSGDVVRWRGDGELEFVGRADHQVKVRGFRIELGDIEAAIRAAGADAVREVAVVVDSSRGAGSERLVAFVGAGDGADGAAASRSLERHLLAACAQRLPAYMVPSLAVVLERLPKNSNGKVDRRALHAPQSAPTGGAADGEAVDDALLSPTEREVREVWAEALQVSSSSIVPEDNFFAGLGGNSLLAGRVTAMLRKRFLVDLAGTTMYVHSTVKRLAQQVDSLVESQGSAGKSDAAEAPTAEIDMTYRGYSSTSPLALAWQAAGILIVELSCELLPALVVYLVLGGAYYNYGLRWWLLILMPATFLLDTLLMMVQAIVVKWAVLGRIKPGSYPLWGLQYLRWWFVDRFLDNAHNLLGLLAETPLINAYYRALGAKIDGQSFTAGEALLDHPKICTPDLVEIGLGVSVRNNVTIGCTAVYGGMLHAGRVEIGAGCELEPGSYVTPGTRLPPRTRLLPMATSCGSLGGPPGVTEPIGESELGGEASESLQRLEARSAELFWRQQHLLRMLVGLPWLGLLFTAPYLASLVMMDSAWGFCQARGYSWSVFWYLLVPLIMTHGYSVCLVSAVILQKRLLIGRLGPGVVIGPPSGCSTTGDGVCARAHWATFRRWLHERSVTSHAFDQALDPLVNTELLSWVHRLLGAKVGRRVQSDNFQLVDHDCVEIEDFVVFGSEVQMNCDAAIPREPARRQLRPIRLLRAANCLDHSLVMPGVVVGEGAVLGTRTLAQQDACFPPDSISTGCVRGRSVLLRTEASLSTPAKDRALELSTMHKIESPLCWGAFNCAQLASAAVAYCLPSFAWMLAADAVMAAVVLLDSAEAEATLLLGVRELALYTAVWICAFCAVEVFLLLLSVALKWAVVGRYEAVNHAFFSDFHYRWAVLMNFKGAISPLAGLLSGTAFNSWFYRGMGSKIGRNAYLSGIALEYDLLEVGDGAAINCDCDATAHTVERMVLKMERVRLRADSAMLAGSVVMPGGLMEPGALLLERSQVLKGDVVQTGEVWAGQPAQRVVGSRCFRQTVTKVPASLRSPLVALTRWSSPKASKGAGEEALPFLAP